MGKKVKPLAKKTEAELEDLKKKTRQFKRLQEQSRQQSHQNAIDWGEEDHLPFEDDPNHYGM